MASRVDINDFGRVGRCVLRIAAGDRELEFVATNDISGARPPSCSANKRGDAWRLVRVTRGLASKL